MSRHGSTRVYRLASGAIAATAIGALAITAAPPAVAAGAFDSAPADVRISTAADRAETPHSPADATVRAALVRDLDVSPAELDTLLAALGDLDTRVDQLRAQLGDSFGGVWFDHESATLVAGTTDPATAGTVQATGTTVEPVAHTEADLVSIQGELNDLAESDPATMSDAYSWGIDVPANQVLLTVDAAEVTTFEELTADYGDAVRVSPGTVRPEPADHDGSWLDGGTRYEIPAMGYWCSIGFNAHNPTTGDRYFLTAGHCGGVNDDTSHHGTAVGPFVASTFPTHDEALVQITNSYWSTGPFVWEYPGAVTILDARSSPVGTPVCASGITTEVTCGVITQKGATANYSDGPVFDMGVHNACTRSGDSGGATYSPGYYAEGIHSGSVSYNGACPSDAGLENQAFYQEVTDTLDRYATQFGAALTVGS
ncbi:alpha-lytic protease prodomain-containing protein [Natronosporangium hydrolyticum]|uniref:Alpha-lytic protease prodomain-containing protein n=1 Tax=Natronosporangium hydrolyticum TaxID=2811111 RepID=A0A895Y956_9ACTN|nr:trypsin-like serine protease [Natronosporangium hydrolyticum]QSB14284.1 alpha-lytic protease prodomain-containing protein [Natronosporangium hydrolyticum]